jgi:hypothetical protein
MARLLTVIAVCAVIGLGVGDEASACKADSGRAGTKEMVFTFDGWNLGAYGGGIGMRYFLRDDVALRPGLTLSVTDDTQNDRDKSDGDTEREASDSDGRKVGVLVIAEKYLTEVHKIFPFVGCGLGYSYESHHYEYGRYEHNEHYAYAHRDDMTGHSINVVGLAGVQWRFMENMSLGGQFTITYTRSWEDRDEASVWYRDEETETTIAKREGTSTSLGINAGRLLVSVRF